MAIETIWEGPKYSGLVIVPDALERMVQAKIAEIVSAHPCLEPERDSLRHDLIAIWHEYGHLSVEITPREEQNINRTPEERSTPCATPEET